VFTARYGLDVCTRLRFNSSFSRGRLFGPRTVCVKCMVNKVTLGQDFVLVYRFPLSVSFHQRSIFALVLVSLLSDVEAGEASKLIFSNALLRIFFSL
jgi:hypothetical protein